MRAFESLIGALLERDGFWVRSGYKVDLTKEDKRAINRPSCPRWEIDLLAYKASTNELRLVECKSYLDSFGVQYRSFETESESGVYKLFTDSNLRNVVCARLVMELVSSGACRLNPRIQMVLAAGKIKSATDRTKLQAHFEKNSWLLLDDQWIRASLVAAADGSYEDDAALLAVKLLLRSNQA